MTQAAGLAAKNRVRRAGLGAFESGRASAGGQQQSTYPAVGSLGLRDFRYSFFRSCSSSKNNLTTSRGRTNLSIIVPKADRIKLIKQLQELRGGTTVISYITSTRQGLEIPMAMDSIRKFYDHIKLIGKPRDHTKIDLFLHSNGGDGTVPWRLVTLLREHASRFAVLVPYKAYSAATLTALGADSIVMHPIGMLGPTDPTVANPFNPRDPNNQPIGISVEDVSAYIALVREDAGINHEDQVVEAFKVLADKIHPLALGNVKRSLSQSRMMATKLLALHMTKPEDEHKIKEIVEKLTSKLFYHGHPINRSEAKQPIGLPTIEDPPTEVEDVMWKLYLDYEAEIKMEEPFDAAMEFIALNPTKISFTTPLITAILGFIESIGRTDVYSLDYMLSGGPLPPGPGGVPMAGGVNVGMAVRRKGWTKE